jgi:hypothetical protein
MNAHDDGRGQDGEGVVSPSKRRLTLQLLLLNIDHFYLGLYENPRIVQGISIKFSNPTKCIQGPLPFFGPGKFAAPELLLWQLLPHRQAACFDGLQVVVPSLNSCLSTVSRQPVLDHTTFGL